MKTYVIAHMSFHENVQNIYFLRAESAEDALFAFSVEYRNIEEHYILDMDQDALEEFYFDMDEVIGVTEVGKDLRR